MAKKNLDLIQKFGFALAGVCFQESYHTCQITQVAGISTGKGHAFSAVRRHIQGVIPVGVTEPVDIMLTYFVEGAQLLDEQMFQNASFIDDIG